MLNYYMTKTQYVIGNGRIGFYAVSVFHIILLAMKLFVLLFFRKAKRTDFVRW